MKEYILLLTFLLVSNILTNSISLTVGYCEKQNNSKKEAISDIFFMFSTGQLGCSYYGMEGRGKIRVFPIEDGKEINLILLDPRETANLIASSHEGKLRCVPSSAEGKD